MPSSEIWLTMFAGLFGLSGGVIIPFVLRLLKRKGFIKDTLEIRLASGDVISGTRSDPDFNRVFRDVVTASIENNTSTLQHITRREQLISDVSARILDNDFHDIQKATDQLTEVFNDNPTDRRIVIWLGRLLKNSASPNDREAGLERAIDVLSRFVAAKTARGELDKDYADVLYNLACYKSIFSHTAGVGPERQLAYREQAIDDLKESTRIAPGNIADALVDVDFNALRSDPSFIQIVGADRK